MGGFISLFKKKSESGIHTEWIPATTPKILWIELTSTCPFDCIFCSRRSTRGTGAHMDFDMFRRLMAELKRPAILRLNYAGESIHYPHLIEAIDLAAKTGARTELVTSFSSYPHDRMKRLVESGLDNLTISLHTLDEDQYTEIYRHGSLGDLKRNVAAFLEAREKLGKNRPTLSLAFVAFKRNLHQLPEIARYADALNAADLSVQPVMVRDPTPVSFHDEVKGGSLDPGFRQEIVQAVEAVKKAFPERCIKLSCMEHAPVAELTPIPRYFSGPLPSSGRIYSCDQNPWESVHILSNGDVAACEVLDKIPLGNLRENSLSHIWRGDPYQKFRERHMAGEETSCRLCPYKIAYLPAPMASLISASGRFHDQLLRGWHPGDDGQIIWSMGEALAVLKREKGARTLRVAGLLPWVTNTGDNHLDLSLNGAPLGRITNASGGDLSFDEAFPLGRTPGPLHVGFQVKNPFRPGDLSESPDIRELGFALIRMEAI